LWRGFAVCCLWSKKINNFALTLAHLTRATMYRRPARLVSSGCLMPPMMEHAMKLEYVSSACWCARWWQLNSLASFEKPSAYSCVHTHVGLF
jgi:hypothetical protein